MLLETIYKQNTIVKSDSFFNENSKSTYKEYVLKTISYIYTFLENKDFYSSEKKENLEKKNGLNLECNENLNKTLEELKELYLDHTISFHHPNYVAHLNCPVVLPALIGDIIASSVNTAVETWDQSISATLIEQKVIRWICDAMGYTKKSDGVFTSGGTQSNFMALLTARDDYAFKHFGLNLKENGWADVVSKFRIFCSNKSHFSIKKNAALLGMGYQSVIPIKTDDELKLIPDALILAIEKEKQKGNIPIAVIGTAGTTDFGSFDPLETIGRIAKEHKMWFHVDGAYGGCYIFTETHKHLLKGVEQANSITIDFHKTFFQPVCSSVFLVKNAMAFKYVSHYADYLNPLEEKSDDCPNLIEKSIQTTRRFDALKLWFTLKMVDIKTIAGFLEQVHYLVIDLYCILKKDTAIETIHKPELSTLVFRYKAEGVFEDKIHDQINLHIKNTLFNSGKASVASTKSNGILYLKFTLLNPENTVDNLLKIVEMIKETGSLFVEQKILVKNA